MRAYFVISCLALGFLLGGCASYQATQAPNSQLSRYTHIFVENNLDDNHQIDQMLVSSLRSRGIQAESGPNTLVPDEAQAILSYQDHWNWDFSDHLVGLSIQLRDARKSKPLAIANFTGPVSITKSAQQICDTTVTKLLTSKPVKLPPPPPAKPKSDQVDPSSKK